MSSNLTTNPVALFIKKTYGILQNDLYQKAIHWLPSGSEFTIVDATLLQEEILPKYFRHNNFHSFVRQLNMYGFHKCRKDPSKNIFVHEYFRRGREDLLPLVKRKIKILQKGEDPHSLEESNTRPAKLNHKEEEEMGLLLLEKSSQDNLMRKRSSEEKADLISAEEQKRCSLNLMICPSGEVMNENPEIYSNMRVQDEGTSESDSENISIDDEIQKQRKVSINLRSGVSLVQTHTLLKTHNHIFNDS